MSDPYRKIVVDIDGTLCETSDGKDYAHVKPIQDVIDTVNRYHDAGYHVTIFTARGMHRFRGDASLCDLRLRGVTEDWLMTYGVKYDRLMFGKPSADIYIDDKGLRPDEFITRDPD